MKKKTPIIAGAALALGLALGAPAAAMADPYAPIASEQNQVVAPGIVTLTTAGWNPGEVITVTYPDSFSLAATTTTTASGSGTSTLSFATSTTAGTYTIVFTGISGSVTFNITVDPSLAYTGTADPAPYLWLGGGLAVLGAAAVVTVIAVRRQNAKEHLGA